MAIRSDRSGNHPVRLDVGRRDRPPTFRFRERCGLAFRMVLASFRMDTRSLARVVHAAKIDLGKPGNRHDSSNRICPIPNKPARSNLSCRFGVGPAYVFLHQICRGNLAPWPDLYCRLCDGMDRPDRAGIRSRLSRQYLVPAMFFGVILAFQVYGGVSAVLNDVYHPLSRARDVARFIVAKGWAAEPIVGFPDYAIAPIVGYLGIRQAYYPQGSRWGSFTIWDQRRLGPLNFDQALVEVKRFGSAGTWIAEASADDPDLMRKYAICRGR